MKAKCEAPAKFKEFEAKVVKQHPKSKVCQIRVDGGGEYGSREKFLEYLAEEGIIREISAQYSQQQNGISERCNRRVLDPARSMMLNMLGCQISSGPMLCPQLSTSRMDYHPELSPIRPFLRDGLGRSPISPISKLSAA